MTLKNLYDMLDWTQADKSLAGWNKTHGEEHIGMGLEEVRYRRCIILHNALHADSPERRQFCIKSLMGAGVWDQIESILGRNDAGDDLREADTTTQGSDVATDGRDR